MALNAGLYDEVKLMRHACGEAHLKTILATGELGNMVNVYRASMVCMMAGRAPLLLIILIVTIVLCTNYSQS